MCYLKPIPTEYNGILYRSKLEAKWAAYFTMCGAVFEYEPQAFDLGDGIKYLPDFCVKNVRSVHGGFGDQLWENSLVYPEFWFECKGVMSDYDAEKIRRFRDAIRFGYSCPFYVLDRTPLQMHNDFHGYGGSCFEFGPIDGDDEFPFVIGAPIGLGGLGLFGGDSNYTCYMDDRSSKFAAQVESMFKWNPKARV